MEIYLADLSRWPELSDISLEEALEKHRHGLIRVPDIDFPLFVGRSKIADIVLTPNDEKTDIYLSESGDFIKGDNDDIDYVSRYHCKLRFRDNIAYVVDNYSHNGTRVNGVFISSGFYTQLRHGDRLALGKYTLRVLIPEEYRANDNPLTRTTEALNVQSKVRVNHEPLSDES